jgi:chitodextrinase
MRVTTDTHPGADVVPLKAAEPQPGWLYVMRKGCITLVLAACADDPLAPSPPSSEAPPPVSAVVIDAVPTILAAGDIASCSRTQDNSTGNLIRSLLPSFPNAIVAPLGDLVYPYARPSEFTNCYAPAWGSFKAITRPVVGNHEYDSASTAQGYVGYFGSQATAAPGMYYSYNVGTWHIVVLNTYSAKVSTKAGSAQDNWLVADLKSNTRPCILGLMHHPRFFSSTKDTIIAPLDAFTATPWQRLYAAGADLILTGHAHGYERFAPLTPSGGIDAQHGITEIVVGTGGESQALYKKIHPASRVRAPKETYGVLRLRLLDNRYTAKFVATAGTFTDSLSVPACHGDDTPAPSSNAAPTAAFTSSCSVLNCTFTDASRDIDGTIVSRSWSFGDNTTSTATSPSKSYAAAGTYNVTLTVRDNGGSTATTSRSVVLGASAPPSAYFGSACVKLSCSFTDRSVAGAATIVAWSWAFGDGTGSTTRSPSHVYPAGGSYKPTLTVKDGRGATSSILHIVTVAP